MLQHIFLKDDKCEDNDQPITTPIPKPPAGPGQFADLHLKLKMKKSVYKSYRVSTISV